MTRSSMTRLALLALVPLAAACASRPPVSSAGDMAHEAMPGDQGPGDGGEPGASLTLTTPAPSILLRQGGNATVALTLARGAGADGAVEITVDGLPAGVSAQPLTVAAGATSATLALAAGAQAAQAGPIALTVSGHAGTASGTLALQLYVGGAPGTLDQSWGSAGVASIFDATDTSHTCGAMTLTSSGRPVIGGYLVTDPSMLGSAFITGVTADGQLDATFGQAGSTVLAAPAGREVNSLAMQPDGKILVSGAADWYSVTGGDSFFSRLTSDGSLETGYGQAGFTTLDVTTGPDTELAVALQPDGKLVALVFAGSYGHYVVARFDAAGALDPSFGDQGIVQLPQLSVDSSSPDFRFALLLQANGDIVIGGATLLADGGDGVLTRLTSDGTIDPSFGTDGNLFIHAAGGVSIDALASAPDGSIIAAGSQGSKSAIGQTTQQFAVFHASVDGVLDSTFGSGGSVIIPVRPQDVNGLEQVGAVVVQPDGKIIVASTWAEGTSTTASDVHKVTTVIRFDPLGALDPSFADQGILVVPAANNDSVLGAELAIDPIGRIIVAGYRSPDGASMSKDCSLLRIWP